MTKEAFEARYCTRSGISLEAYHARLVTLPCRCNDEDCQGWAAVSNDPLDIKVHLDLYDPERGTP